MSSKEKPSSISPALEARRASLTIKRVPHYAKRLAKHDFTKGDVLIGAGLVGGLLAGALAIRAMRNQAESQSDAEATVHIYDRPAHHMPNAVSIVRRSGSSVSFPRSIAEVLRLRKKGNADNDAAIFTQTEKGTTNYVVRDGSYLGDEYRKQVTEGLAIGRELFPDVFDVQEQAPEKGSDD